MQKNKFIAIFIQITAWYIRGPLVIEGNFFLLYENRLPIDIYAIISALLAFNVEIK